MDINEYKESLQALFRLEIYGLDALKKEKFIKSIVREEFSNCEIINFSCPSCKASNLVEWPDTQSYLRVKCSSCKKISSNFIATVKSKRRSEQYDRRRYRGQYVGGYREDHFLYIFRVITPENYERQFELVDSERMNFEIRAKDKILVSFLGYKGKRLIIKNLTVNKMRYMLCQDEEFLEESKKIISKMKPVLPV